MASPSNQMKNRFRLAKKNNPKLRMKSWARQLVSEGDQVALAWFFNKSTKVNKEAQALRLKNKGSIIAITKAATKAARHRMALKRQGKDVSKMKTPTQPVVVSS